MLFDYSTKSNVDYLFIIKTILKNRNNNLNKNEITKRKLFMTIMNQMVITKLD